VFPGNGKPLVIRVIFLPHDAPQSAVILSVGIDLKEELGGSAAEMFEILPRKLKADFHSKMNVCRHELVGSPPPPDNSNPRYTMISRPVRPSMCDVGVP